MFVFMVQDSETSASVTDQNCKFLPYTAIHECTLYTHVTFYFPNTYLCTHADKHFFITSHTQRLLYTL